MHSHGFRDTNISAAAVVTQLWYVKVKAVLYSWYVLFAFFSIFIYLLILF